MRRLVSGQGGLAGSNDAGVCGAGRSAVGVAYLRSLEVTYFVFNRSLPNFRPYLIMYIYNNIIYIYIIL